LPADKLPPIIPGVARRIHIPVLRPGSNRLDPIQAHHVRDVLRLTDGATVEAFDDAGATAPAILRLPNAQEAAVWVDQISPAPTARLRWTIASAIPKGDRADWMVEKLSELGADAFIPLAAARSVVLPEGKNKRERWMRLATEAAKQSRRAGVMRIEELTPLEVAVAQVGGGRVQGSGFGGQEGRIAGERRAGDSGSVGWFFATEIAGIPIAEAIAAARGARALTLFIGPEGGWTVEEIAAFERAGLTAVKLTSTVLRVETAAIAAAAVVASMLGG
jgi:16S rRNA (uracil1498-N3)-methyltransferase